MQHRHLSTGMHLGTQHAHACNVLGCVQVIDAEMARRKLLEDSPIPCTNEDPVNFDTSEVPWWAWVRRFHLPEVSLAAACVVSPHTHACECHNAMPCAHAWVCCNALCTIILHSASTAPTLLTVHHCMATAQPRAVCVALTVAWIDVLRLSVHALPCIHVHVACGNWWCDASSSRPELSRNLDRTC